MQFETDQWKMCVTDGIMFEERMDFFCWLFSNITQLITRAFNFFTKFSSNNFWIKFDIAYNIWKLVTL